MRGERGWLIWWAAFAALCLLLARTHAGETKAEMRVSATVIHACRVVLAPEPAGQVDAEPPRVDCGVAARREDAPSFRILRCDRFNRAPWCVQLRERHPGFEIRAVRFD